MRIIPFAGGCMDSIYTLKPENNNKMPVELEEVRYRGFTFAEMLQFAAFWMLIGLSIFVILMVIVYQ